MKTRNGFISNSSSSSFILMFKHKPKNINDLKEMMFPDSDWSKSIEYYDNSMTIEGIVKRVFLDLTATPPKDYKDPKYRLNSYAIENVWGGNIENIENNPEVKFAKREADKANSVDCNLYHQLGKKYGYENFDKNPKDKLYKRYVVAHKVSRKLEDKYCKAVKSQFKKFYNNFIKQNKNYKFTAVLEYGERYRGESVLEHGDVFANIPHITISNH